MIFKNVNKTAKVKRTESKLKREQRAFSRKLKFKKGEANPERQNKNIQKIKKVFRNYILSYPLFVKNM